jgi:hypothetical protein
VISEGPRDAESITREKQLPVGGKKIVKSTDPSVRTLAVVRRKGTPQWLVASVVFATPATVSAVS